VAGGSGDEGEDERGGWRMSNYDEKEVMGERAGDGFERKV
jgi:hypothetical protein